MHRLLLVAVVLMTSLASAAERPIVAVFDMEDRGSGLDKQVLVNLTDYLASLLAEGGYQVVPRDQIRERLKEQKTESYKECYDQSCQIELGRELAAQNSLDISILKIGNKCQMTANLYDLKKATTVLAANADAECNEESLLAALKTIGEKLCRPLKEVSETAEPDDEAKRDAERARKKKGLVRPLSLESMTLVTTLAIDQSIFFGDVEWPLEGTEKSFVAGGTLVGFEYAFEYISLGAALPVSFSEPEVTYEKSMNMVIGNPTLRFKARWCTEGEWAFCFGTSTSLSAGFWDWMWEGSQDDEQQNQALELLAHEHGLIANQDPTYHYFQKLVVRPLGVVTMTHKALFAQCQLGIAFDTPIVNTDAWDSFGAALMHGLAGGYRLADWFFPVLEVNGWTILAGDDVDTSLWLNLGAQLEFGDETYKLRVAIPLTDGAQVGSAVQFQLGFAWEP
jgi:hypothetical protein